jgi:hypothetical protein
MQFEDLEAEIRGLTGHLDRVVPRDGAHLLMKSPPGGTRVVGNRLGYLRLGIELLKAALDPVQGSAEAAPRIDVNAGYLLPEGSVWPLEVCELDESISSRPPVQSGLGALGQLTAGVLVVAVLILLFIGAVVVLRWVFG